MRPMWACPRCGRAFANRNQSHACGGWLREAYAVGRQQHLARR